ncbi:MAG: type II secretion system F family protein [Candidatus Omnitrophota bacterium]
MAKFSFTAKANPKEIIKGSVEAESEQDAINKITKKGYFPVTIAAEEKILNKKDIFSFRKITSKDIAVFTRQLSGLVASGVNIINSLNIISKQTSNRYLKATLNDVIKRIKDGNPLAESIAAQAPLFSPLYCSMIRTGEASGNLKVVLSRLSDFLEKEDELKNSVIAALTYPLFVFMVGISTVIILLVFVVPGLITMFKDMGQVLPLPTRILIGASDFLRYYGWLLAVLIFAAIVSLNKMYLSPRGRLAIDKFKLKAGWPGRIILKNEISRLMRSLSLLVSSGMPITSALDIAASILQNKVLVLETDKFKEQIKDGQSLSLALENFKIFPEFVKYIVAVGEETGSLDKALASVADEYDREVDRALKTFTRLLEPVIILVIGLVVAFIVLSMLLPIFEINFLVK